MGFHGSQQPFPQIHVLYRILPVPLPVLFLPAVYPVFIEGLYQVLRVRINIHLTGSDQRLQSYDSRQDLHAVVGSLSESSGQFSPVTDSFRICIKKYRPIAARSRIASGRSVSINSYSQNLSPFPRVLPSCRVNMHPASLH